jgi:ParB-like chromosome segregation protein Spo0J
MTTTQDFKIKKEFATILGDLGDTEIEILEKNIAENGVTDPITIWKGKNIIIDGHNRYRICQKMGIDAPVREISLKDEKAAEEWIVLNQLGRRNLTKLKFDYLIGKYYNIKKGTTKSGGRLSKKIGKEHGVSEKTVRRAGDFASGTDRAEEILGKLTKKKILSGKSDLTKADVEQVGKAKNTAVAKETLNIVKKEAAKKVTTRIRVKAAAKTSSKYSVVFAVPNFSTEMSVLKTQKPSVDENAFLFVECEDHDLAPALELVKHWGFGYQASVILNETARDETSAYTKIKHQYLLISSRGIVAGPAVGKEPESIISTSHAVDTAFNLIEKFTGVKNCKVKLAINCKRNGWVCK